MTSPRTNPLAEYSSYTYQLTWYICTPEEYNAFLDGGKLSKVGKIIVQSGGSVPGDRAAGFNYDYYIENTKLVTMVGGSVVTTTEIKFDVIEPMGFSFIHDLKIAAAATTAASSMRGVGKVKNAGKHFFIFGIRFVGYDASGSPQPPKYEKFYAIHLTEFKFKLDGKATVYHITAAVTDQHSAHGDIEGRTINNMQIKGKVVGETIGSLMGKLNAEQALLLAPPTGESPKAEYISTYAVDWSLDKDKMIQTAKMAEKPDHDKSITSGHIVKRVGESNPKNEAASVPDFKNKMIQLKDGTSIVQAIEQIVASSVWAWDRHNAQEKNRPLPEQRGRPGLKYRDIRVTVKPTVTGFDTKRNMWVYDYLFGIQPYDVESLRNTYLKDTGNYPGPHKSYEYWFTGKNTEVIKYEHCLDMLYWIQTPGVSLNIDPANVTRSASQLPDENKMGGQGKQKAVEMATHKQLIDIASNADSKMTIYGDPDYLMDNPGRRADDVANTDYQNDGHTINANSGIVFIDVKFKEAIDYLPEGYLEITDNFVLWEQNYPGAIRYMVIQVDSTFARGQFTQELSLKIAPFETFEGPGEGPIKNQLNEE